MVRGAKNLTASEMEHMAFRRSIKNETFIKNIKNYQPTFMNLLLNEMSDDDRVFTLYGRWLLDQMKRHYIIPIPGGRFNLINKNRKSLIVIGLLTPHKDTNPYLDGFQYTLEIESIHSDKKGEGYKMMSKIIDLAKTINLPISLWSETDRNVRYFERYGFKSFGRIGANKEHLMIKKIPKKVDTTM